MDSPWDRTTPYEYRVVLAAGGATIGSSTKSAKQALQNALQAGYRDVLTDSARVEYYECGKKLRWDK